MREEELPVVCVCLVAGIDRSYKRAAGEQNFSCH